MKKHIVLFSLVVLIANGVWGQVAIIKVKDGYTNVRMEPHADSKVIHKILDAELFTYEEEPDNKNPEWVKVYVPKSNYAINGMEPNELVGFIHVSRLLPINQLEKYTGNALVFKVQLGAFTVEDKIIDYHDHLVEAINGRRFYGTDGDKPKIEIKSMEVSVNGKKVPDPKVMYEDLFECRTNFSIHKYKDVYFIEHSNSDGAGGYLLAWAVDSEAIRQRLIMIP